MASNGGLYGTIPQPRSTTEPTRQGEMRAASLRGQDGRPPPLSEKKGKTLG